MKRMILMFVFVFYLSTNLIGSVQRTGLRASATTVRRFDLEEMVQTAERIFLGTCLSTGCERDSLEICTRTSFRVAERIKGTFDADTLVLRLPGGTLDGVRFSILGMPSFEPGEEVVLFLSAEDEAGYPWVVGLSQGKFSVVLDPLSGKKVVVNGSSGLAFSSGPLMDQEGVDGIVGVPLDAFLERIRGMVTKKEDVDLR